MKPAAPPCQADLLRAFSEGRRGLREVQDQLGLPTEADVTRLMAEAGLPLPVTRQADQGMPVRAIRRASVETRAKRGRK